MFEKQLQQFFECIPDDHAHSVLSVLERNLPLMKAAPHIAAAEIRRFRSYLTEAPADNIAPAIECLWQIAAHIPELRGQIIQDFGDLLYEYKGLAQLPVKRDIFEALLTFLEVPVSPQDCHLTGIARSVVSLGRPAIVIAGAGFSYDTMPINHRA